MLEVLHHASERMFALGLRIKNKEGEIVRFVLNQAQTKVMEAIHRQLETAGKIRLVVMSAMRPPSRLNFFQVMRSADGQTPRVACAGLHSRRYI